MVKNTYSIAGARARLFWDSFRGQARKNIFVILNKKWHIFLFGTDIVESGNLFYT